MSGDFDIVSKEGAFGLGVVKGKLRSKFWFVDANAFDIDEANEKNSYLPVFLPWTAEPWSSASVSIPVGVWTHVAATYDKNEGVERHYVQGQLVASRTVPGFPGLASLANSNARVIIGTNLTLGNIDEVMIFDHAITGNQLKTAEQLIQITID